jgi:hypothetical protein
MINALMDKLIHKKSMKLALSLNMEFPELLVELLEISSKTAIIAGYGKNER